MNKSIKVSENRDFKGVWIPAELYLDSTLNPIEKFIIVEVDSLSKNGECYASNQHFADFIGLSVERTRKIISNLVSNGYLESTIIYHQHTKQVEKRILRVSYNPMVKSDHTPMVENDHTPMVKSDHISNTVYKNTSNEEYTIEYNSNNNNNLISVDNNKNLSMNTSIHNTSAVSTTDEPENHIEEVYFSQIGQIEISLSKAYEDIQLKRDTTSQEKITDFFLYFVERYTEHTGHKPYPIKYDKLITFVKRLVNSKLINGGHDSILNYDTDEIEWMIDDYFDYDFEDCNYSIHHFMSKKILSTRFRRLQNKYPKTA